ncbi:hypothetical protein Tco_1391913 [Tanacetum coccineum]
MTKTSMDGNLRKEKPKWVLDNAASSHIYNDRAMFETLNGNGQFGEIKVGSKHTMKIEGVGSVRFKLHNGSVKTALNVKYVPGAARNILLLGALTSRGYRYVGRKDTCKVYKTDQLVIRGRKIPNNLCYLEGEALVGESSSDPTARTTRGFRADYGFVGTLDNEIRQDPEREDTDEIYGRLDDAQDDRSLMSGQLNMLRRDRRAHARTARLMESEARLSRVAWVQLMDASDTARSEVRALQTTVLAHQNEIGELRVADRRRQIQLTKALTLLRTLQTQMAVLQSQQTSARDPAHPDVPEEAGSSL